MNNQITLELNPDHLASIIDSVIVASTEIVNFHFAALDTADLAKPVEANEARYRFKSPALTAAQRRALHEHWILAKAFQDLLRAVRHAMEEAHVYIALLTRTHKVTAPTPFADFIGDLRAKATALPFPKLMDAVNDKLVPQIDFSSAYVSLQTARNCLEHRNGIVTKIESQKSEAFCLRIPRVKMFYLRDGMEIEIKSGHIVDPGDDRPEVDIMLKLETTQRLIPVGAPLSFTASDFNEIAFACHHLGIQLATKLPKPS